MIAPQLGLSCKLIKRRRIGCAARFNFKFGGMVACLGSIGSLLFCEHLFTLWATVRVGSRWTAQVWRPFMQRPKSSLASSFPINPSDTRHCLSLIHLLGQVKRDLEQVIREIRHITGRSERKTRLSGRRSLMLRFDGGPMRWLPAPWGSWINHRLSVRRNRFILVQETADGM